MENRITNPTGYTKWRIEPSVFLIVNQVPFAEGNIIKYVMRWRSKNGVEDLKKAKRYIEMLIEVEDSLEEFTPVKRSF